MFAWFEIEYIVLDNGHSHVHEFYRTKLTLYVKSLNFFTLQKSICILIKNCMILLRLSTLYVEIPIVANIIFKIINKSHNFFYTLEKCRPSHRISRVLSSQNLVRDARYIRYSCGPVSDSPLSHAWKWRTQVGKRITGIPCVNVFRTLSLFPVWTIEESKVIELNPGPDIITTVYRIIIVFRR